MTVVTPSRLAVHVRRHRAPAMQARSAGWEQRRADEGIILTLLMPSLLVGLLAAMTWSFWALASSAWGELWATIAVVAAVVGAAVFSRCAGWSFVAALILVGCGGLLVSVGGIYVVATVTLINGG